jgi:hypothetical protein
MKIERYDLLSRGGCHCELADTAFGKYVLFTDHEADKAAAVAEATKELRAELVGYLAQPITETLFATADGWYPMSGHGWLNQQAEHLVEIGAWEKETFPTTAYRPIEPQSSGGSDEN